MTEPLARLWRRLFGVKSEFASQTDRTDKAPHRADHWQ